MTLSKFTDPAVFGPGLWFSIHTCAIRATTNAKKQAFIEYMEMIASSLKCENCRMHATKYIAENPMDRYIDDLFRWTWIFHNAVNRRLEKSELDYNTAYNLYINADTGVCRSDCGEKISPSSGGLGGEKINSSEKEMHQPIGVSAGKSTSLLTSVLPPPKPPRPVYKNYLFENNPPEKIRYVPTSARTNQKKSSFRVQPNNI